MSIENGVANTTATVSASPATAPDPAIETPVRYKSWRKKYRKMKARFDEVMKVNNTMFKEEQKLEALAKRLQEQNDQLMDMLLDLNSSLALPAEVRYNIDYRVEYPELEGIDIDDANRRLSVAYEKERLGQASHAQSAQSRVLLEGRVAASECRPLSSLEKEVPHTVLEPADMEAANDVADPVGYMTPTHEAEYLDRLDAKYSDSAIGQRSDTPPPTLANMTAREVDRAVELRNPLSVHNWLKKHNPSLDVGDGASEAGTPATGRKGGGRGLAKKVGDRAVERARDREDGSPISSATAKDLEFDEEVAEDSPARGRRSKGGDDDGAYRPKGGRSGKTKRKREDHEPRGGSKRPKTSLGAAADV